MVPPEGPGPPGLSPVCLFPLPRNCDNCPGGWGWTPSSVPTGNPSCLLSPDRPLDPVGTRPRLDSMSSVEEEDYDTLTDIESDKNVIRTKVSHSKVCHSHQGFSVIGTRVSQSFTPGLSFTPGSISHWCQGLIVIGTKVCHSHQGLSIIRSKLIHTRVWRPCSVQPRRSPPGAGQALT